MSLPNYPSLERLAELQQFVANFSRIERVPQLADTGRPENDVEHSFGLALTCWYLAPKIAPELSLEKILCYALAHDTVEIHAGDTFSFGPKELVDSKPERERAALEQLQGEWPDFPDMVAAGGAYMDKANEEARFVKAVDKLLPMLMIELGEKGAFWQRHKITLAMEVENKVSIKVSDIVAPYYDMLVAWMTANDDFYKS